MGVATFAEPNNALVVPSPKAVNLGDGNDWIPLFVQGVITSNLQQYSGLQVIDRQNLDTIIAEQKGSESVLYDESTAPELGKLTSARFIVTGSITGKGASYALMFSITDAETGETKATATVPNCLFSALENGEAANLISYDLMTGYGVELSAEAKAKLTKAASVMTAETTAQASVAKGIVAEKSGSNIEALTYYIQAKKNDKHLSEAASRASAMSTAVASGNFGAKAKNLIKMRNDWDKLLRETAELIASNPPTFELLYSTNVKPGKIDYDRGTMEFVIPAPILRQNNKETTLENIKLVREMQNALAKIPESKDWGDAINKFPVGYIHWKIGGYYSFDFFLLDSNRKKIGACEIEFKVPLNDYNDKSDDYWFPEIAVSGTYSYNPIYSWERKAGITFIVSVQDADTDNVYISVENSFKWGWRDDISSRYAWCRTEDDRAKLRAGKKTPDEVTAIMPLNDGSMTYNEACSAIHSGEHNGTVKIVGRTTEDERSCALTYLAYAVQGIKGREKVSIAPVSIDMSELEIIPTKKDSDGRSRKPSFSSTNLTGIVLPKGLGAIPDKAFMDCTGLGSITIPASVEYIGKGAFSGCTSLKTLTILAPFTCSPDAFEGCKFDTVNFPSTKDDWKGLKKVIKAKKINFNYKGE